MMLRNPLKGAQLDDFYLNDARWALISSHLPGKDGDPGCHGRDNRLFIEAVLWIARTGSPWRELPGRFGKWYTAYTRFRRWTMKGVWPRVFEKLATDESCEYFYHDRMVLHAPLRPILSGEESRGVVLAQTAAQ
jgi:transposase